MGFHRSSHAVWDCRYHLVWSTKYRRRALQKPEQEACEKLLRRIAEKYGMNIVSSEVDDDHVHLYVEIPPQRSVGEAVRILKSISARAMFKRFPNIKRHLWGGHLWEASYFARSVGDGVTAEMVKRYIEQPSEKAQISAQLNLFEDS
jgi:putative transposase